MSKLIIDEIKYRQEADSCGDADIDQMLTVEFDSAGAGYFYRLITDGWSLDEDATVLFKHLANVCERNDRIEESRWEAGRPEGDGSIYRMGAKFYDGTEDRR